MSDQDSSIPQPANKGVMSVYRSKGELFQANLIGGIAWGFGTVIGATIIVAIILLVLNQLGGLPVIGTYIQDFTNSITDTRQ